MPEYHVRWEIDVSADSPEHAARVCREIQLDPTSTAAVFEVSPAEGGPAVMVDLDERVIGEPSRPWRPADNADSVKLTDYQRHMALADRLRSHGDDDQTAADFISDCAEWFEYELDPLIRRHLPDPASRPEGRIAQLEAIIDRLEAAAKLAPKFYAHTGDHTPPLPATAWYYQRENRWVAVVAEHEPETLWFEDDVTDRKTWPIMRTHPIEHVPNVGTLIYRRADGSEVVETVGTPTSDPATAEHLHSGAVRQCITAGTHLTSVDDDGYCNVCGYQDGAVFGTDLPIRLVAQSAVHAEEIVDGFHDGPAELVQNGRSLRLFIEPSNAEHYHQIDTDADTVEDNG